MSRKLIIGLDLSLNSTGICIAKISDNSSKIGFYRIVHDKDVNKNKSYSPKHIKNVNQIVYRMPKNILTKDLILSEFGEDRTSEEQLRYTLKAMMCAKVIRKILAENINQFNPDTIIFTIENYIMPSFSGKSSLATVGGNICLQSLIREFIIQVSINLQEKNSNTICKLFTPTPTSTKKFFTGDGNADKLKMIHFFTTIYNGEKLINLDKGKIDDIVDSFALMFHGYSKYLKQSKNIIQSIDDSEELSELINSKT